MMLDLLHNDRTKPAYGSGRLAAWLIAAAVGVVGFGGAEYVRAGNVSWGTTLGDSLYQSDGSALDDTFKFQLGVFIEVNPGEVFQPTGGNTSLWDFYWRPFDEASDANEGFNVGAGFVNRTNPLNEDGTTTTAPFAADAHVFFDQKPYVWAFNDKDGDADSEWALYTDTSWGFPSSSSDSDPTVYPFRLPGVDTVVFGGVNDTTSATGTRSFAPETFDIQTHAVPEPTAGMLVLIGLGMLPLRRRR